MCLVCVYVCVCVCVCVCLSVSVTVSVNVKVCVCVRERMCVFRYCELMGKRQRWSEIEREVTLALTISMWTRSEASSSSSL